MGRGFEIRWVGGSIIYHGEWVQNTMGKGFYIPWVGGSKYHETGFEISWIVGLIYH